MLFRNPYALAVKKYCAELLNERYHNHENLIERYSEGIHNEKDTQALMQMFADFYEKGYMRCLRDYEVALKKLGYEVNLRPSGQKDGV